MEITVQVSRFQREKRYQILPAYTQDGVLLAHVFQGSTDATVFEEFIEQLLPLCGTVKFEICFTLEHSNNLKLAEISVH
jgi:hypothetical protein